VTWADELPRYVEEGRRLRPAATEVVETASVEPGHLFGTRTHDEPTVVSVETGEIDVLVGPENPPFPLRAGDAILVPAGCLHGLRARTASEWSRATVEA